MKGNLRVSTLVRWRLRVRAAGVALGPRRGVRALPRAASGAAVRSGIRLWPGRGARWSPPPGLPSGGPAAAPFRPRITQDWVAQQEAGTSLFCLAKLALAQG